MKFKVTLLCQTKAVIKPVWFFSPFLFSTTEQLSSLDFKCIFPFPLVFQPHKVSWYCSYILFTSSVLFFKESTTPLSLFPSKIMICGEKRPRKQTKEIMCDLRNQRTKPLKGVFNQTKDIFTSSFVPFYCTPFDFLQKRKTVCTNHHSHHTTALAFKNSKKHVV